MSSGNGQWAQFSDHFKPDNVALAFFRFHDEQARTYLSVFVQWVGPKCATLQRIAGATQAESFQRILPRPDIILRGEVTEQRVREEAGALRRKR